MGEAQGKKVAGDSVAAQTIEAQPVFGQIEPSQRPGASRAETQPRKKSWLISVLPYKRLERLGVEKEVECGNSSIAAPRKLREGRPSASIWGGTNRLPVKLLREDNSVFFRSGPEHRALIYANLFDDEGEEIIPRALQP